MVGIGSETPDTLTNLKSNVAIRKRDVKRQYIAEVVAARSANNIVAPKIKTNANT